MSLTDTVQAFTGAVESGDFSKAESLLAGSFTLTGGFQETLRKDDFLTLLQALKKAFPDMRFNLSNFQEEGNEVHTVARVTGTHTGHLSLPAMELSAIEPTNKALKLPDEPYHFKLKDGQIDAIRIEEVPGGGLEGLVQQLGLSIDYPDVAETEGAG
ncbi:MAG TPA: nuclear transport factor 2 family protein [Chloroflexia bacterium]|nr:nuclear transport factor 2 family protein [Chloroflexia bacterium]